MARDLKALGAKPSALSLRQLRFFVLLAELENFSRAAEKSSVTQPALSAAIRQIESLLSVRLFERTTHRVVLTEAGLALLPHAQRLLATAENAFIDMRDVARRERTTIRIGAIPSAVSAVSEVLAATNASLPSALPHISDGLSDALIAGLRKGAFDMIVSISSGLEPNIETVTLAEDAMLLVLRSDHGFSKLPKLAWSALAGEEVVHFAGGSIGDLTSAALRQNGLAPSAKYRVDHFESLYALVRSGLAIGVLPRLYTRALTDRQLRLVPLVRPVVKRRVALLYRRQLQQEHPLAARFAAKLASGLKTALSASSVLDSALNN
jgi:LysR family carnitine catabolism transcriptional activator